MTIEQEKIIERWTILASTDLGYEFNGLALDYFNIFNTIFKKEITQFDSKLIGEKTKRTLRGFAINHEGDFEKCSVIDCLDLHIINFDREAAEELDWYLMNESSHNWFSKYQFALNK